MKDKLVREFIDVVSILVHYGGFAIEDSQRRFFAKRNITDEGAKRRLRGEYQRHIDRERDRRRQSALLASSPPVFFSRRVILGAYSKERHDKKVLGDTDISQTIGRT